MKFKLGNGHDNFGLSGDYLYFFRGLTEAQELKLLRYFGRKEMGKTPVFWERTP